MVSEHMLQSNDRERSSNPGNSYACWSVCMQDGGRRFPGTSSTPCFKLFACGLRGAVAYGLAVNLPNIDCESDEGIPGIESAALVIVLVSTLLFGGITGAQHQLKLLFYLSSLLLADAFVYLPCLLDGSVHLPCCLLARLYQRHPGRLRTV